MITKIIKSTSKGQITLPKSWRNKFHTDCFMLRMDTDYVIIKPINVHELSEEVVFDADRDNKGKGVSPDEIIRVLKKIKHG